MSDQKPQELNDDQLKEVSGGNQINPITKLPGYTGPYVGMAYKNGSIAQQEINSDATDNNLPDSGGGVIV
jgi:bacteriocin-like protein